MSTRRTFLAAAFCAPLTTGCADFVRSFIYYPPPHNRDARLPGAPQPMTAMTDDGLTLTGALYPPAPGKPVILFFHGNASDVLSAAQALSAPPGPSTTASGVGLLLASYRGYFGNPGRPHEAGLAKDAVAFFAKAAEAAGGADRVVIAGHSLGGGVAFGLAAHQSCRGLVTIATFTDTADVAPPLVAALLPDRYPNAARVTAVKAPLLIAHGDADTVIPFRMGEVLRDAADRAGRPGGFLRMPGVGHSPGAARMRRLLTSAIDALDDGRAGAFTDGASGAASGFGPWRVG